MLTLFIAIVACGNENLRVPLLPVVDGKPVIVHLVSRDHVVSVTAGPQGPLYSAKTKEGAMVASGVTLQQLREEHPDVYRQLHPAISADASVGR
jgi:hypothetical protein